MQASFSAGPTARRLDGAADAISHVLQTDSWGCTFAVIAMLTGRSYASVRDEIRERFNDDNVGATKGITYLDVVHLLIEAGYWTQLKYRWFFNNQEREVWPPAPWAELHYCEVIVKGGSGSHAVVVLADGTVLDPLTKEPRQLADYEKTNLVVGLRA